MAWPQPLHRSKLPQSGDMSPEQEASHFDFLRHLLLKRRLARLSAEDVQRGISAVEAFLPVLPAPTVRALEQVLTGAVSPPEAGQPDRPAGAGRKGVSAEEVIQAIPRKTLQALRRRQMKDDGT